MGFKYRPGAVLYRNISSQAVSPSGGQIVVNGQYNGPGTFFAGSPGFDMGHAAPADFLNRAGQSIGIRFSACNSTRPRCMP